MSTPEIPTPENASPEKEKKPEGRWALFTGVGSFVLYLFGYLSLRFHLSVLGVDTGLSVWTNVIFLPALSFWFIW
jgi:hypothetical protein